MISKPPNGPPRENSTKTKSPMATVGILNRVWIAFTSVLFPGKLLKWITLASGRQIRAAMTEEVAHIINDLPAISMTSRSNDIIRFIAFVSPSHSSVNAL